MHVKIKCGIELTELGSLVLLTVVKTAVLSHTSLSSSMIDLIS